MTKSPDPLLVDVLQRRRDIAWRTPQGEWTARPAQQPVGLLSGSFNPLHDGHRELQAAAAQRLGGPVGFELPVINAEKPPLDLQIALQRVTQFDDAMLAVTNAATFVEKSRLLNATMFIVGYDTAERILQPRFYQDDESKMQAALSAIATTGCRFLVAGRVVESAFLDVNNLSIPAGFRSLFVGLSEDDFRNDISSTDLRERDTEL